MNKRSTSDAPRRCVQVFVALVAPISIFGCNKTEPAAAASPAADAPIGYTVAVSTDSGKSLITQKSNVTTVQAALLDTLPDLAAYFDAKPTIGSAYQDAHDSTTGGTTFSDTLNGQPVRGLVSCKLHDGGASIAVVYGRTDAPKADWEKLMKPPADQAAAAAPGTAASGAANTGGATPPASVPGTPAENPSVSLTQYDYADGTGSVGLVTGWNTQSQSAIDPTAIIGPADQAVFLHNSVNVATPNSMAVQQRQRLLDMQAQNAANFAQRGYQLPAPKPLPPLMVAPFTDPVTAIQNMIPQFSKRSEFNNGPSLALDRIISSQDLPCQVPNGKRALITYAFTKTLNGQSTAYRTQIVLVTAPLQGTDAWMWFARYSVQAPDSTFDHDLPTMMAMVNSEKVDQNRAMQVANARNQQMQQMWPADGGQRRAAAAGQLRTVPARSANTIRHTRTAAGSNPGRLRRPQPTVPGQPTATVPQRRRLQRVDHRYPHDLRYRHRTKRIREPDGRQRRRRFPKPGSSRSEPIRSDSTAGSALSAPPGQMKFLCPFYGVMADATSILTQRGFPRSEMDGHTVRD